MDPGAGSSLSGCADTTLPTPPRGMWRYHPPSPTRPALTTLTLTPSPALSIARMTVATRRRLEAPTYGRGTLCADGVPTMGRGTLCADGVPTMGGWEALCAGVSPLFLSVVLFVCYGQLFPLFPV